MEAEAKYVYEELDDWITERISFELAVCEKCVAVVQKAIEDNSAIVRAWKIDGVDLLSDPRRLLVAPAVTVSEPLANVAHDNFLEDYQIAMLESALSTAANAESISGAYESPAMLSVPTLRNALLRMAARDSDLPELWAQTLSDGNFDKTIGMLDAQDTGFVSIAAAVDYFQNIHLHP